MTNREKLNSECMYDLLCRMNNKLLLRSDSCIMSALCESPSSRCAEYKGYCDRCIEKWLNEEARKA